MERCLREASELGLPEEIEDAWLFANADQFFFGDGA
jgi:hypothetical protein